MIDAKANVKNVMDLNLSDIHFRNDEIVRGDVVLYK